MTTVSNLINDPSKSILRKLTTEESNIDNIEGGDHSEIQDMLVDDFSKDWDFYSSRMMTNLKVSEDG